MKTKQNFGTNRAVKPKKQPAATAPPPPGPTPRPRAAEPSSASKTQRVRFTFVAPDAQAVCIAGSFNDWDPAKNPLASGPEGTWGAELSLSPGRYEYRFWVDGEWRDDPACQCFVANPFGGRNSVVEVSG